jgi:hypothetical protein
MINIFFNYVTMFYTVFTESLFIQIFAILIFYAASKYIYAPRKNWYYPEQEDKDALH